MHRVSAFWILYFWKEWTMTTKFACFFSLGFQSLDTKHAREMWSVSLVSAGLVKKMQQGVTTCWERLSCAPEPPEHTCSWRKGPTGDPSTFWGAPSSLSVTSAFVARFVTSVFFNQSWILKGISPCLLKQNALEGSRMWISPAMQPLCWTMELLVPCWWTRVILFMSWLLCREQKFLNLVIWRHTM